jgi:aminoglycoside phosphotransferase
MVAEESELVGASVREFLLSTAPAGSEILAAWSYRPGYRQYPMRVSLRTPGGAVRPCVIKTGDRVEAMEREARVLQALAEVGLPVPELLAGPVAVPEEPEAGAAMLLSEMPGEPLPWLGITSLGEADLTCRLLIRGILRLHQLTERIHRHEVAGWLPRVTLSGELEEIVHRGREWGRVELFARAVDLLPRVLPETEVPLVFSNGDYNPLNFLHEGESLTGWIDFENSCFEDPYIGFAKFLIWSRDSYGWGAGVKAGLIERYLYAQNVSRREFASRLVLRCLRHLQQEVSVEGEGDAGQREHMLSLLREGVETLEARGG